MGPWGSCTRKGVRPSGPGVEANRGTAGVERMLCASGAVDAHHSFAMFDHLKLVTIDRPVQEFQWSNPHCWLTITTQDGFARARFAGRMGDSPFRP